MTQKGNNLWKCLRRESRENNKTTARWWITLLLYVKMNTSHVKSFVHSFKLTCTCTPLLYKPLLYIGKKNAELVENKILGKCVHALRKLHILQKCSTWQHWRSENIKQGKRRRSRFAPTNQTDVKWNIITIVGSRFEIIARIIARVCPDHYESVDTM